MSGGSDVRGRARRLAFAAALLAAGSLSLASDRLPEAPAPLPGFGRTCEILLGFRDGAGIDAVERAIGLDPATRRVIGDVRRVGPLLRYKRSDGLVATFSAGARPADPDNPHDRLVYQKWAVIRQGKKIWIAWRLPDFTEFDYFGFVGGAPKEGLPFDPLGE